MNEELIIRNASPKDIEALVELLRVLFAIETDFVFDAFVQRRGIDMYLDGCGKHRCIRVAEVGGRIIGMACVQSVISTAEGGPAALLEDIVVHEHWRGKGVGRRLLQAIQAWCDQRGIRRLQLLADKKNTQALGFYDTQGWNVTDLICLRKKK